MSYQVDEEDLSLVGKYKWSLSDGYLKAYYEKSRLDPTYTGKRERSVIYMHRLIMDAQDGDIVDHINQDRTDNRRVNLRLVNKTINALNSDKTNNSTGYRGVIRNRQKGKPYKSRITVNGKQKHLGMFDTPEEAHEEYLKARKELLSVV